MYADTVTPSMMAAIGETERRRARQDAFNEAHGIVPRTIVKNVRNLLEISKEEETAAARDGDVKMTRASGKKLWPKLKRDAARGEMLEFEYAAVLRDGSSSSGDIKYGIGVVSLNLVELLQSSEFGKILITFFVSMLPVIELRGAIPLGVSMGLDPITCLIVSLVGNLLPVPFIIVFIRRILDWMKTKSSRLVRFAERLEKKAYSKRDIIYKGEIIGLILFVAVPLPGTGAWTGSLIAALLNIRLKAAIPAITIGVVIAGILVVGLTYGFTKVIS
jgi:uncharacterized membrane protein